MNSKHDHHDDHDDQDHGDQESQGVSVVLHEVIARVGMPFGLSIAQRAQRCADELLESGDAEAIRYMLVEGWERELSRLFTHAKSSARRASKALVIAGKSDGETNGYLMEQLTFPVIVPGRAPVPLGLATHVLIAEALDSEERQLAGRQQNVELLRKLARLTAPWPNVTVSDLLARRSISAADLTEAVGG